MAAGAGFGGGGDDCVMVIGGGANAPLFASGWGADEFCVFDGRLDCGFEVNFFCVPVLTGGAAFANMSPVAGFPFADCAEACCPDCAAF